MCFLRHQTFRPRWRNEDRKKRRRIKGEGTSGRQKAVVCLSRLWVVGTDRTSLKPFKSQRHRRGLSHPRPRLTRHKPFSITTNKAQDRNLHSPMIYDGLIFFSCHLATGNKQAGKARLISILLYSEDQLLQGTANTVSYSQQSRCWFVFLPSVQNEFSLLAGFITLRWSLKETRLWTAGRSPAALCLHPGQWGAQAHDSASTASQLSMYLP